MSLHGGHQPCCGKAGAGRSDVVTHGARPRSSGSWKRSLCSQSPGVFLKESALKEPSDDSTWPCLWYQVLRFGDLCNYLGFPYRWMYLYLPLKIVVFIFGSLVVIDLGGVPPIWMRAALASCLQWTPEPHALKGRLPLSIVQSDPTQPGAP